jgi:hypothetical protein
MKQLSTRNLTLIALVAVTVLAISVFAVQKDKEIPVPMPISENQENSENQGENGENMTETVDTSDWKIFKSDEVGISFEYPIKWRGVVEKVDDALCLEKNENYQLNEDSCRRVYFSTKANDYIFLVTETEAYTQMLTDGSNGRGAAWYEKLRYQLKSDYCNDNPYLPSDYIPDTCEKFETKNGIKMTEIIDIVPFTDDQMMTSFFFQSPISNTSYREFVFSLVQLGEDMSLSESDARKMIESITFF